MYLLIQNQAVAEYPYSDAQLKRDNPQVSFPKDMTNSLLESFGVMPVTFVPAPTIDQATQTAVRDGCELVDGNWQYKWRIDDLTPEQIEANRKAAVPQAVTMRQARLALLGAGVLATVDAAIAAMPGMEGHAARIEWEYAHEIRRDSPLVAAMSGMLGLDEAALDQLFLAASGL